jgi:hypothetical protein
VSLFRSLMWSLGIVCAVLLVIFLLRDRGASIGFMKLRVLNDTGQTVKVQPCWDMACFDVVGLHETLIPAGASKKIGGQWQNNIPSTIVVGVLKPHAEAMHFDGCLLSAFPPGRKVAVFRVSREGLCPTANPGGGG